MSKLTYKTVNKVIDPVMQVGTDQVKDNQSTEYFEDNDEDRKPDNIENIETVDKNNQTDVERHSVEKEKVKNDGNKEELKKENENEVDVKDFKYEEFEQKPETVKIVIEDKGSKMNKPILHKKHVVQLKK